MAALIGCRIVLWARLVRSGVEVTYRLVGVPWYLERRYAAAPEPVRLRLASVLRWHRVLLYNLLLSIVTSLALLALLTHDA